MENEERTHLEAYYQNELKSKKNEVARMTNLLKQLFFTAENKEGMFAQPHV